MVMSNLSFATTTCSLPSSSRASPRSRASPSCLFPALLRRFKKHTIEGRGELTRAAHQTCGGKILEHLPATAPGNELRLVIFNRGVGCVLTGHKKIYCCVILTARTTRAILIP